MEQVRFVRLEEIFNLQDRVMQQALGDHQTEWEFVKDCIELILNRRIIENRIAEDNKKRFQIVHTFLNDAISSLINSIKIGLYGCYADSMTLLRPVIEDLAILSYVISKDMFNIADYELNDRLKKLRFDEIIKSIKDGEVIKKLHSKISGRAAHVTVSRIGNNRFDLYGQSLPTVGMAIDPKRIKKCLHEIMGVSLYMTRVLTDFYSTKTQAVSEDFFTKEKELETRYSAFKSLAEGLHS